MQAIEKQAIDQIWFPVHQLLLSSIFGICPEGTLTHIDKEAGADISLPLHLQKKKKKEKPPKFSTVEQPHSSRYTGTTSNYADLHTLI